MLDPATGAVLRKFDRGFDQPLAAGNGVVLVRGPGCGRRSEDVPAAYLLDAVGGQVLAALCAPGASVDFGFYYAASGALVGDRVVVGDSDEDSGQAYVFASCTDGVLTPGEECDDGNAVDGDGCDHNCTRTRCANGISTPGETCRDDALRSIFDAPGPLPLPLGCADHDVPADVYLRYGEAWDLVREASLTLDRRRASRLLRNASRLLGSARAAASRAGRAGKLDADCAGALATQVRDTRVRASRFRRTL